ncbi:HAD hydrolase-like protein [Halalkalicoccus paucihalophilus]
MRSHRNCRCRGVEVFKLHSKAYENIENYTDCSLEDCTMVATHTFDVAGAQAAGMKTILVNRFNVPATRLSHTPDMVVDSYAKLATKLS